MDKWEDIAPAADAVARELAAEHDSRRQVAQGLSLIHISEPTRL